MQLSREMLEKATTEGSKKVAEAMTILTSTPVVVEVSRVESIPFNEALNRMSTSGDYGVVVYSNIDTVKATSGVSLLTIARPDALMLVDILNRQADGTTRILKEIDRSAIKEMLNILSNSYANAIAEAAELELLIDTPSMITVTRLQGIISQAFRFNAGQTEGLSIVFETTLTIASKKIKVGLYLIFNEDFAKLCCSI